MVLLSVYFKDCRHHTVLLEFDECYLLVLFLSKNLLLSLFLLDTATFNTVFIYQIWEQSEPLSLSFEDRTEVPKDFRKIMSP